MEQIKEAFSKVKQDIDSLKNEVSSLNNQLIETRSSLVEMCEILKNISRENQELKQKIHLTNFNSYQEDIPSDKFNTPTHNSLNPTYLPLSSADKSNTPTYNTPYSALKRQNKDISIGNKGVPTDRQTNQQTNQQTNKGSYNTKNTLNTENIFVLDSSKDLMDNPNSINDAAKILDSLDALKKEVRLKFKRLTDQEFLVFSSIYQAGEEKGYTDYKNLSENLNLTESSIRDYVGRLIKKGISVEKTKINNKTIHLSISPNLKKIASLSTILQLRTI